MVPSTSKSNVGRLQDEKSLEVHPDCPDVNEKGCHGCGDACEVWSHRFSRSHNGLISSHVETETLVNAVSLCYQSGTQEPVVRAQDRIFHVNRMDAQSKWFRIE